MISINVNECPGSEVLAQLAAGSLVEQRAIEVFDHLDQCNDCQKKYDDWQRRAKGLSEVQLSDNSPGQTAQPQQLASLIRKAQQLEQPQPDKPAPAAKKTPVSRRGFIEACRRSGLLSEQDLDSCLDEIEADDSVNASDSSSLAKELINRDKLTPFQARVLLRGKWKGLVLGKYSILDRVGKGGMGNVFKALHTGLGRTVCLKVVNSTGKQSPQGIERFRNEARALAALSHSNIVVAHDADEYMGTPFLVMEFVEGKDLARTVYADGPLSEKEALMVGLNVAEALQYAHGQGLIHRDVKPHNIVLTTDPETGEQTVKVLDLGLARFDSVLTGNPDASLLAAMTNTGVVIGTVDYMAPEQALDSRKADSRSDIYSLGCTLFFLLTGKPPFEGETIMQRLIAHREQPVPSVANFEIANAGILDAFFSRILAKNPDDRYQTMAEVAADLNHISSGSPICIRPIAAPIVNKPPPINSKRAKPSPANSGWRLGFSAAVLVVLALTLTLAYQNGWIPISFGNQVNDVARVTEPNHVGAPQRIDAECAIKNGGQGRALLVVSSDEFDRRQFSTLTKVLKNRQIDLVMSSPRFGEDKTEYEMELRKDFKNIRLDSFDPGGFDVVFFIDGDLKDLTVRSDRYHDRVKSVFEKSSRFGVNISTVGSAWRIVEDAGYCTCEPQKIGTVKVFSKDGPKTPLIQHVDDNKDIVALVMRSFENLEAPNNGSSKEVL